MLNGTYDPAVEPFSETDDIQSIENDGTEYAIGDDDPTDNDGAEPTIGDDPADNNEVEPTIGDDDPTDNDEAEPTIGDDPADNNEVEPAIGDKDTAENDRAEPAIGDDDPAENDEADSLLDEDSDSETLSLEDRIAARMELAQIEAASVTSGTANSTFDESAQLTIGKSLILWSFNQPWDQSWYRVPFYQTTEADWDAKGLDTTVIYNTTVNDYKGLKGYDVVIFSGHGEYHSYNYGFLGFLFNHTTVPSLLLTEESSKEKDNAYVSDLKGLRVGKYFLKDYDRTIYAIFTFILHLLL